MSCHLFMVHSVVVLIVRSEFMHCPSVIRCQWCQIQYRYWQWVIRGQSIEYCVLGGKLSYWSKLSAELKTSVTTETHSLSVTVQLILILLLILHICALLLMKTQKAISPILADKQIEMLTGVLTCWKNATNQPIIFDVLGHHHITSVWAICNKNITHIMVLCFFYWTVCLYFLCTSSYGAQWSNINNNWLNDS